MRLESDGEIAVVKIFDVATGKHLSRAEFFDVHAMTLLVIAEVEARAKV